MSPVAATDESVSDRDLHCPQCGYSLRALASDRCPECGSPIDRELLTVAQIPWVHRRSIGRFRAYRRTVFMVFRRPGRVGQEVARPVSYADATRFRWVTAVVATVPGLAAMTVAWFADAGGIRAFQFGPIYNPGNPSMLWLDLLLPVAAGWMLWYLAPVYVFLTFIGIASVGSYWFGASGLSTEQQDRALALASYACAPLALLWAPLGLLGAAYWLTESRLKGGTDADATILAFGVLSGGSLILILVAWWLATLKVLRWTTRASGLRLIVTAALLPVSWLLVAMLSLVVVPAVVGFFSLVVDSFR